MSALTALQLARVSKQENKSEEMVQWLRHAVMRGGEPVKALLHGDPEFKDVDFDTVFGE